MKEWMDRDNEDNVVCVIHMRRVQVTRLYGIPYLGYGDLNLNAISVLYKAIYDGVA
jgi:hypothetical protein